MPPFSSGATKSVAVLAFPGPGWHRPGVEATGSMKRKRGRPALPSKRRAPGAASVGHHGSMAASRGSASRPRKSDPKRHVSQVADIKTARTRSDHGAAKQRKAVVPWAVGRFSRRSSRRTSRFEGERGRPEVVIARTRKAPRPAILMRDCYRFGSDLFRHMEEGRRRGGTWPNRPRGSGFSRAYGVTASPATDTLPKPAGLRN